MAGLYLHIPFCKTRCIYCDFYSTTGSELKARYIHALCSELKMRRAYLQKESIETIYFGGGTPSQLSEEEFKQLFDTIQQCFGIDSCQEITLEANPDDLSPEYLNMLREFPFNRISIGIQTFNNATLRLLNRRHSAEVARKAVEQCRAAGFQNISIDLIYGLPEETIDSWKYDLQQAISLNVEHISAYHLIYEKGTPIYNMLQKHQINEVDEERSIQFFSLLIEMLQTAGYEHYEISNFCLPGKYSLHNSSYWKDISYLGCGASAHSFNHSNREWNIASIDKYIKGIEQGKRHFETEYLDPITCYNEFIITSLRTKWGVPSEQIQQRFGTKMHQYYLEMAAPYLKSGKLIDKNGTITLTQEGIFISDSIMSDLLYVEE